VSVQIKEIMEEEFKPRRYACKKWPFLRYGKVKFEGGFVTIDDEELCNWLESSRYFGLHVFPIKFEPKPVPVTGKVEELIEKDIADALAAQGPRIRRGAIGTR
jgi:hypothetical protein